MIDIEHEYDPEILRQVATLLDAENRRLHTKVRELIAQLTELKHSDAGRKQLELELGHLQEMLAQRNHALFGDKSERRPRTERSTPERPPAKPHGRRPQPSLRALERIWELDEPDEMCPKCRGELTEMKDQFEESEEIDVVQRQFVVVRHKRKKYRCSCNACIDGGWPGEAAPRQSLLGGFRDRGGGSEVPRSLTARAPDPDDET